MHMSQFLVPNQKTLKRGWARYCHLLHSSVTPCDHWSATKVPFHWVTCCCDVKWRKVAIWIIRLLRFPCQCCSLQMVPMPVSSQYRDQRCQQGGNLGNTYLTYQKNKIKTTGLIGLHQQANMAALYHESEFVWVCKLILYSSVFLPWELALSAITKAFAWKDDKKIA